MTLPERVGQERFQCLSKVDSMVPFCQRIGKWFWLEMRKGSQSLRIAIGLLQSMSWWLCQPPKWQGQGMEEEEGLPSSLAKDQLETNESLLSRSAITDDNPSPPHQRTHRSPFISSHWIIQSAPTLGPRGAERRSRAAVKEFRCSRWHCCPPRGLSTAKSTFGNSLAAEDWAWL